MLLPVPDGPAISIVVLLSATAMGLASCPLPEPLEIPETREAVRADVFGTSGYPQMLVRMGWAAAEAGALNSGTGTEEPLRGSASVETQ